MSTNATVVSGRGRALLIDPAWMPDELDALATEIDRRDLTVIGGFATHAHHDHLLWHPRFGDAPRWASAETARLAEAERPALLDALGADFPAGLADLMGRVRATGDTLPPESVPPGVDVELIVHDGHAPGHTAVWLPRQHVLLAGDMLSDIELPLPFAPDDLPSYMAALDLLAPFAAQASVIVPGHGSVGSDALARLDADRRYLDDMIRSGSSDDPRVGLPGMADAHARVRRIARDLRGGDRPQPA
ncbi:MBL fold metallo-hydrolase [Microbacterium sp. TNHR37B]|uniref:MBL fold metallo-hydrolase n=1 Tax=Microbacterium sp. TNHR37B TaxID=1775956 RepID=UPI001E522ECF|nr:MBL fold metallo-hydrolase [Microbacterium sp. TNHR37B]